MSVKKLAIPLTFLCVYQASIKEPEDEGYDENSKSDSGSDPPSKPPSPPPEGANMIPGKKTYIYSINNHVVVLQLR